MNTTDELQKYLTSIADSIRTKEGSTEKIKPIDFSQRIDNMQVGGGTSDSNIEYLDVSRLGETNENLKRGLVMFADIVKSKNEKETVVGMSLYGIQTLFGSTNINDTTCVAVAVDFSRHIKEKTNNEEEFNMSIYDIIIMMGAATAEQLDSIPRLTKEQFYTLE